MALYNKRPNETTKKRIIEALTPEATKIKQANETAQAKVKGIKSQVKKLKKVAKKPANAPQRNILEEIEALLAADNTAVDKFQSILNKFKKVEEAAPKADTTPKPRGGENYRQYN